MSYNIIRNFGYLLEPVLSDLVETEKHANSFIAYCMPHTDDHQICRKGDTVRQPTRMVRTSVMQ